MLPPTAPAAAAEPLTLGVFPRYSPQATLRMFMPLTERLAQLLGRPVKLAVSRDYEAFWEAVSDGRYDIVHYNQYHYIRSHQEAGYRAVVRNQEFGNDAVASTLVVRKDRGIDSLADLRGRKIIFGGGPTAMVSSIMNRYLLSQAGLHEGDYIAEYAVNPVNAVYAAYYGHADAAGAGDIALDLPAVKARINTDEMTYLARSPRLAHILWAVRAEMDAALRDRIRNALIGLSGTADGRSILHRAGLSALIPARDEDYDEHRRIIWVVLRENYCVRNCAGLTADAAIGEERTPLVMSVIPRREKTQTARMFRPLADYLAAALGREVRLVTYKTLAEFWKGLQERRYDIVQPNPYHYLKAHKLYGYDVIVKNEEFGSAEFGSAIYTRRDSGIDNLAQLKGKHIIYGGGNTAMISYIGNVHLMRQAGLNDADYSASFSTSALNSCVAVFLRQADACGAGTLFLRLPSVQRLVDVAQMKLLASNTPFATLPWAVKQNMPEALRNRIVVLLTQLDRTPRGRQVLAAAELTGLREATDSDYDPHRRMVLEVLGELY